MTSEPSAPLIEVTGLKKYFPLPRRFPGQPVAQVHAVDDVSFTIGRGETLSLVGESGCGKSTVGRTILGLLRPTAGEVKLDGQRIDNLTAGRLRPLRRRMQVVFQDPFSSLNPRLRVRDALAEPIANFSLARTRAQFSTQIASLLEKVRLSADAAQRFPHEFSGGQRQRIGIARALATGPELIICDEAVSALDVSVKAQIVNLLAELQDSLGLSLLFITHDLAIVEHLTHRVAVMYLGRIVEMADRRSLFSRPWHPYTQALLSAVPVPDPMALRRRTILKGDVPSPVKLPSGCRFHTRCPRAFALCRTEEPQLRRVGGTHAVACHLEVRPGAEIDRTPLPTAIAAR